MWPVHDSVQSILFFKENLVNNIVHPSQGTHSTESSCVSLELLMPWIILPDLKPTPITYTFCRYTTIMISSLGTITAASSTDRIPFLLSARLYCTPFKPLHSLNTKPQFLHNTAFLERNRLIRKRAVR